ncbi:ABC transporter permease [Propionicicella superfundia]|uniref:ABC transporter permease n=1 Tax=Propionicicella superfundia TaxID=348582 RepID=UPI00040D167D|nr:FtsX-like permease family protein [Propionicicella superfundia]
MIDLTMVLRGAALLRTRRFAAVVVLTVVAGLLAGLGGLAAQVVTRQTVSSGEDALKLIYLLPASPRGEERPLRGRDLAMLASEPGVAAVRPSGRYGFTSVDESLCPADTGCVPWFLSLRLPAIQPEVTVGREPVAADEVLIPAELDGTDYTPLVGTRMEIQYTFMTGPGTGEPRERSVTVVGVFDIAPSPFEVNAPAYGTSALLEILAAAATGSEPDDFDSDAYEYPEAFVEASSVDAVPELTSRLTSMGYAATSLASMADEAPRAMTLLNVLIWALVLVAGVVAIGLGSMVGSAAVAERAAEIGTLRAVGWSRGRTTRLLLGELAIVGLGCALGAIVIALGVGAVAWFWKDGAETLGVRLTTFPLPPWPWLVGVLAGIPASLCLGAAPAVRRLVSLPPDDALREL